MVPVEQVRKHLATIAQVMLRHVLDHATRQAIVAEIEAVVQAGGLGPSLAIPLPPPTTPYDGWTDEVLQRRIREAEGRLLQEAVPANNGNSGNASNTSNAPNASNASHTEPDADEDDEVML